MISEHLNLKHKVGQGISVQEFIDRMQVREMQMSNIPNTKQAFLDYYQNFTWQNESHLRFFRSTQGAKGLYCLVLCTDWCPDVIWNVPVLLNVMQFSQIPIEVLPMEEHLETMDLFLTDGGRAQPVAVLLDKDGDVLFRWGPRPRYIQAVMDEFKRTHPNKQADGYEDDLNEVYRRIGEIYHDGLHYQNAVIQELMDLFEQVAM